MYSELELSMRLCRRGTRGLCCVVGIIIFLILCLYLFSDKLMPIKGQLVTFEIFQNDCDCSLRCVVGKRLQRLMNILHVDLQTTQPSFLLDINNILSQLHPDFRIRDESLLLNNPQGEDYCSVENNNRDLPLGTKKTDISNIPCTKVEISRLITIIHFDRTTNFTRTLKLLQSIRRFNTRLPTILATLRIRKYIQRFHYVNERIVPVGCYHEELMQPGRVLNQMIQRVKTPYILVTRDVYFLNDLAQLEKSIHLMAKTKLIQVVGGSFRNESGYWKIGCANSQIKNYFLKYTEGYKYSVLDCMICDHLEGPFLAKTSLLKKIPFNENHYASVMFNDWFLKVKQHNVLVANCPNSLYFKTGPLDGLLTAVERFRENSTWLQIAKEWQVTQVFYPSRVFMKFSCDQLRFDCQASYFRNLLLPPCCTEEVAYVLDTLSNFTQENKLDFKIDSKTLLGAIKFKRIQPWDSVANITFAIKDRYIYRQNFEYFRRRGLAFISFRYDYFRFDSPDFSMHMFGKPQVNSSEIPEPMRKHPTRVKLNGVWVRAQFNPGQYVKNMYGLGYLKHSFPCISTLKKGRQVQVRSSWKICPKEAHHASFTRYSGDGTEDLNIKPIFECFRTNTGYLQNEK